MLHGGNPLREGMGFPENDDEVSTRHIRYTPSITMLDSIELIPERINKYFNQINHTLSHTLILASDNDLLQHAPRACDIRFIPSTQGARQDNYQWANPNGRDDLFAFRNAAAEIAKVLVTRPIAPWSDLLPGSMDAAMGQTSSLYLADYWVLTLHHLVWTKRLPYPIKAQWVQGSSIHDDVFFFTSELPVDLAETSKDALILFKESATQALRDLLCLADDFLATEHNNEPSQPPIYVDGLWQQHKRTEPTNGHSDAVIVEQTQSETPHKNGEDEEPDIDVDGGYDHEEGQLLLDDQRFTVRLNGCMYQFSQRNKQLFALLERIVRRPGIRVDFDALRSIGDVWDGAHVEDSTIRGAVTRLRRVLKENGLTGVAQRIMTGTYRNHAYVVLKHNDSIEQTD